MTKASDNQYPKLILEERLSDGSDTSNPAADHRAMFLGEDGALHLRDSAGTITDVTAAGGSVATDAIFDAKGDLAVGTGANTAQQARRRDEHLRPDGRLGRDDRARVGGAQRRADEVRQ